MDEELRQQLLDEASRIGDDLLSLVEQDENGFSWKTMAPDYKNEEPGVRWHKSESIYAGVSGIALFFLELYRQTKSEKYLNAAMEGMRWVERQCQNKAMDDYAFFTGRMGISYALLRLFGVTGESRYLEKALRLASGCAAFLDGARCVNDLINGTSGTLLGLLHLHLATGEMWILGAIESFIEHLLAHAHHGPVGLYWDRSPNQLRGLCGFSHGAAGIGFVFLELGYYFQNEAFYRVAEQAFLYESYFWDESRQNWPDFRKGVHEPGDYEKHKAAYLAGDIAFFTEGKEMSAWCHGAPGIGLSRLRAFELLQKPLYKHEAIAAIEKTRQSDVNLVPSQPRTFVLCHGAGGNAELFLEAARTFQDDSYLTPAETVARNALSFKRDQGVYLSGYSFADQGDTSLFMGNAGIGYFYLRLLEPDVVPSILLPRVDSRMRENGNRSRLPYVVTSPATIYQAVLANVFKRTLFVLERLAPEKVEAYISYLPQESPMAVKESFIHFVGALLPTLLRWQQAYVSDVFTLELEKVRMDEAVKSNAWLHIKEEVVREQAQEYTELDGAAFLDLKLVIAPGLKILLTAWSWNLSEPDSWIDNLHSEPGKTPVLLKSLATGIVEVELTSFVYAVLMAFRNGEQVHNAIRETTMTFDTTSTGQEKQIIETIIQQVKQLLLAGVLVSCK